VWHATINSPQHGDYQLTPLVANGVAASGGTYVFGEMQLDKEHTEASARRCVQTPLKARTTWP
jgi:hypothetical protein